MTGFDPAYSDPVDYILGITYEIWEDQDLERIRTTYAPEVRVQSPAGRVDGVEAVIEASEATLVEFPDRENLGEDVIWSDDGEGGFLSSHRIYSTATHTGSGAFGPATGTRLGYRVIADCATRENLIYDEWLVRDIGAIVRQMGIDPRTFAERLMVEGKAPSGYEDDALNPAESIYRGTGNDHPAGIGYREILEAMIYGKVENVAHRIDRSVRADLPGGFAAHGVGDLGAFWGGLRSSFPDAELTIRHQIGRYDLGSRPRAALRWTLAGSHRGEGAFGPPSGAEVVIEGISHAEFGPRGLVFESIAIDEVAIWQQILAYSQNRPA